MRKPLSSAIAKAVLLCCCCVAGNTVSAQQDTIACVPVRTIGVSLIGTTFSGAGLTYEQSFACNINPDSVRNYAYWRGALGLPDLRYVNYLFPSIGAGYCRAISKNRKYFVGAGLNAGLLIAFDPTPKELRDYWDSIEFYGGNYINPVELYVIPELNFTYLGKHWFFRPQFTPLFIYERVGKQNIRVVPWGGVTIGYRFNH